MASTPTTSVDVKVEDALLAQEGLKSLNLFPRDVDSESNRPKLKKADTINETVKDVTDIPVSSKSISKPAIDEPNLMLLPYMRVNFTAHDYPHTSTFTPSAFKLMYITHICDDLMRGHFYFRRNCDNWHPFISRLYFGELFLIQTLRQMVAANVATRNQIILLKNILELFPPESLPIPGPMIPIFKSMSICFPPNGLYGYITPKLPNILGPQEAQNLLIGDNNSAFELLIPAIPQILGFCNLITQAATIDTVPDFTDVNNFSTAHPFALCGRQFGANWNVVDRDALLRPGMLYSPETDRELDQRFWRFGRRLSLPVIEAATPTANYEQYMQFTHMEWFGHVVKIMSKYCCFFKGSENLSTCSPVGLSTPLAVTEYTRRNTTNLHNTLTHAFPDNGQFYLQCQHSSSEISIPEITRLTSMYSQYNCWINVPNSGRWSQLSYAQTRAGEYWNATPVWMSSDINRCYINDEVTISEHFLLERSSSRKD